MYEKIRGIDYIESIAKALRAEDKTIITTSGSFDILHYAHVNVLEKAKEEGDILIILLNSDASIKRNKGPSRPIIPEGERARMLAALGCVDYVTIFDEEKPIEYLKRIKPHLNIKGGSVIEERVKEERDLLASWGGLYKVYDLEEGFSTTNIIDRIIKTYNGKS